MVGEEGSQIIDTQQALNMAQESGLDLVMISPAADPPVCRIMDYSKFLYEQAKKQKENRKNQKVVDIKEIRLSASIGEHDIEVKANNARRFLSNGDKVKVSVRFKGRQNNYTDSGKKILDLFLSRLGGIEEIEKPARLEGRNMIMVIAPKR